MTLVLQWVRPQGVVSLPWVGPTPALLETARRDPAAIAVLVGPPGNAGNPGPPGPPMDDYDPGDLTLYFDNAII